MGNSDDTRTVARKETLVGTASKPTNMQGSRNMKANTNGSRTVQQKDIS